MASNVFGLRLLAEPRFQRRALGLVLLIVLGFRAAQFVLFSTQIQWGYDFSAYWLAGRHLLEGSSIYSAAQVAGPYSPQQQYLYLYPPPLAAAVSPLSAVFASYRAANVVWAAIGALIVVGAVLAVVRAEGIAGGPWWFVGAAFAFPPVVGELVIGNVHLLLLGLLSLAWLGVRSGTSRGEAVAGVAVGIASIVKVFPALIVLWFLVTRRWAAAGWAIVGAAAAAVLTLPLTGVAPWLDYPRVLANLGPPTDTTDTLAPTVWLSSAIGFTAARLIVGAVAVAAVGWAARVRSMPVSFAVAVTASVLVAPALYHHYLAILLLPLLIAFRHADRLAWVAAAYLLMWGGMQEAFGSGAWLINRGMPAAGALLLFAGLLAWARRSGDAGISGVGARGHVDSVPASL